MRCARLVSSLARRCGAGYTSSHYYKRRKIAIKCGDIWRTGRGRRNFWALRQVHTTPTGAFFSCWWILWFRTDIVLDSYGLGTSSRRRITRNEGGCRGDQSSHAILYIHKEQGIIQWLAHASAFRAGSRSRGACHYPFQEVFSRTKENSTSFIFMLDT